MSGKKFHVLIIDDDKELSGVVAMILGQKNITVASCSNGITALKLINEQKPDMIILDIMMPGTDGHLILQSFKNTSHLATIPVLMLSSRTMEQDILRALHAGAMDYITKPFDPDDLLNRSLRLLESASKK